MPRSLLNILLAPKESAHQFDTTRRIRRFFNAAAGGDTAAVKKIIQEGIFTYGYENRNFGMFGTREWQLSGLGEAIKHGRPDVIELLRPQVMLHFRQKIQESPALQAVTACEQMVLAMQGLSDHADTLSKRVASNLLIENIIKMSDVDERELRQSKKQAAEWRNHDRSRSAEKFFENFQRSAMQMVKAVTEAKALMPMARERTDRARMELAEYERQRQSFEEAMAKEIAKAEIAAIPVNATTLKRGIRPVKTVKFKNAA